MIAPSSNITRQQDCTPVQVMLCGFAEPIVQQSQYPEVPGCLKSQSSFVADNGRRSSALILHVCNIAPFRRGPING